HPLRGRRRRLDFGPTEYAFPAKQPAESDNASTTGGLAPRDDADGETRWTPPPTAPSRARG
ncbi:hypothetical protein, partial [Gordonia otitidis]|uniref:hypothetical protein n=1 Tax=Gordonia otitidis TaxID=249058 RepID=UPI0011104CC7